MEEKYRPVLITLKKIIHILSFGLKNYADNFLAVTFYYHSETRRNLDITLSRLSVNTASKTRSLIVLVQV